MKFLCRVGLHDWTPWRYLSRWIESGGSQIQIRRKVRDCLRCAQREEVQRRDDDRELPTVDHVWTKRSFKTRKAVKEFD